jgi:predicted esterase
LIATGSPAVVARYLSALLVAVVLAPEAHAQLIRTPADFTHVEDVIYGRKDGVALTMDVFTPREKPNGRGVILCISMKFQSSKDMLKYFHPGTTSEFLNRGYVVFAVVHGSQPKFTVPEIVDDIHRAVRFIKFNAKSYGIERDRLGIAGGSAGGHLSLMMGCAGKPGDPDAADPVERESSKVAAVACFFPPTDFRAFESSPPSGFDPTVLFPFRERDPRTAQLVPVTPERRRAIGTACSPLHWAKEDAAPTLIIHGDQDKLVPLQQSEALIARLKQCNVTCDLVVKKGKGHFWIDIAKDLPTLADWFDKHLCGK